MFCLHQAFIRESCLNSHISDKSSDNVSRHAKQWFARLSNCNRSLVGREYRLSHNTRKYLNAPWAFFYLQSVTVSLQLSQYELCDSRGAAQRRIPVHQDFLRVWRWPLPYRSAIVVPICPGISAKRMPSELIGFLCVDSPRLGAFKKQFDTEVMIGVADGIYNVISLYVARLESER